MFLYLPAPVSKDKASYFQALPEEERATELSARQKETEKDLTEGAKQIAECAGIEESNWRTVCPKERGKDGYFLFQEVRQKDIFLALANSGSDGREPGVLRQCWLDEPQNCKIAVNFAAAGGHPFQ